MTVYKRALVYGATGESGRRIAAVLAGQLGLDVVVAGRDAAAAERTAVALSKAHAGCSFRPAGFAIADRRALSSALDGIELLVVAAPVADLMEDIGRVAIERGADMIDILVRGLAAEKLRPLAAEAAVAGRTIVTQAGFHPGVPGPMVRAIAGRFSRVEAVHVGMAMQARFRDAGSVAEIVSEVAGPTYVIDGGVRRQASYRDTRAFTFSAPLGRKPCYPMNMPEVETVALELGLDEADTCVGGFNWFVDNVVFMLMYAAAKVGGERFARPFAPLLHWGNEWFSPRQPCLEIRAEAAGEIDRKPVARTLCLRSEDPYGITAHCVLAAVRQMIEGPLAAPGVWLMGERIDHRRLLDDLVELGASVWEE